MGRLVTQQRQVRHLQETLEERNAEISAKAKEIESLKGQVASLTKANDELHAQIKKAEAA